MFSFLRIKTFTLLACTWFLKTLNDSWSHLASLSTYNAVSGVNYSYLMNFPIESSISTWSVNRPWYDCYNLISCFVKHNTVIASSWSWCFTFCASREKTCSVKYSQVSFIHWKWAQLNSLRNTRLSKVLQCDFCFCDISASDLKHSCPCPLIMWGGEFWSFDSVKPRYRKNKIHTVAFFHPNWNLQKLNICSSIKLPQFVLC